MSGNSGPEWQCVIDPTGDFIGRLFSMTDLRYTARLGNWPNGITWQHIKHPNRVKRFYSSKLISLKDKSHGRSSLHVDTSAAY